MNFTIYVPNLDRRQDRWYCCLGALLAMGYPSSCIERISAHDGDLYESNEHAWHAGKSKHPHTLFLSANSLARHYYCWSWTWYEILLHISTQIEKSFHLIIVDDWTIRLQFGELLSIIDRVRADLKMIQFHSSKATPREHTPIEPGLPVADTPLKHGTSQAGDAVTLFTPRGARESLNFINRPKFGTPEWLSYRVGQEIDQAGYYSPGNPETRLTRYLGAPEFINPFQDGRQS